ncbi:MAG: HAD-IA family hydrolase [Candidatus Aenigmatarchaeota archaeon]
MKNIVFVFDLDGTIVDSVELHAQAFKYAVKKLGYRNYQELYRKFKKYVGLSLEDIIKVILSGISKKEIERIRYLKDYFFYKNIKKIKPKKRVIKIVKKLKNKGFKIAIFSSSPKKLVRRVLKTLKLEENFDYIVAKEDVKNHKPNPEGLYKIMKHFKTRNIVFVGDSKFDELAAKRAKIRFINVRDLSLKNIKVYLENILYDSKTKSK